ncbi:thymidine kinase 2, mitochondrial-like [Lytechinus pictus]|uniref:thymidine kinase 2, mitochondrial-like n=1 Tax=Lytechinus pictus TaxID=7653 RepID=UPI0030BA2AA0
MSRTMGGQVALTLGRLIVSIQPCWSFVKSCTSRSPTLVRCIDTRQRTMSFSSLFNLDQHSMPKEKKNMTICIEGNIGSGKTLLLDNFSSQTGDVQVIPEPVDAWRNAKGHNMLGLLYKDPSRWSFAFQSYVQLTMLASHQVPHIHPIKMMERSIFSAKYCFVENLYRSGVMSDAEYTVLTEWFNWIISTSYCNIDRIVYLRTSPEHCYERIQMRHRKEETGITIDYLTKLHELYEDWLILGNHFPLPASVVVIDANNSMDHMLQYYKENKEHILRTGDQDMCIVQR